MTSAPLDRIALAARAFEIAREAGQIVLKKRNASLRIQAKKDGSPATAADIASEEHIIAALGRLTPDIPIVAEESSPSLARQANASFWLIDPLDGTKDYIAGESEFTINLALIVNNQPALGVLHAPALEETYIGIPGGEATRVRQERAVQISSRCPPPNGVTVVSSRRHGDDLELKKYLGEVKVATHKRMSSALKFGLIAAGEADLYPRFGRVMGWDVAAGHAIILAAGGRLTTATGQPIDYTAPGCDIPNFIARGRLNC